MTKDRLADYRNRVAQDGGDAFEDETEESTRLTIDVDPPDFPDDLEEFFKQVVEIRKNIDLLVNGVEDVKKAQTVILVAPQANTKMREDLDVQMEKVKTYSNITREKLKEIEKKILSDEQTNSECQEAKRRKIHWADLRIRKTQHSTLLQRFREIMTEFNASQLQYREGCKNRIQRSSKIAGREMTDEQIEEALESGNFSAFTQSYMQDVQMAKQDLNDMKERHNDIIKLENSIRELHSMFMDIAMLVEQQGEMVENIESNITKAVEFIESAKEETANAVIYRSKARRKKIFIIICVIVTLVILAIILALSLGLR